ncbi:MAG: permease [marine bacterium B5-7]|nr:MAG: permease [marine bacterium B5-7]
MLMIVTRIVSALSDLYEGLRSHPGRYTLACLVVAIGVAALSILMAVSSALQLRVDEITNEFGADVVAVMRDNALTGRQPGLSTDHARLLQVNFQKLVTAPLRTFKANALGSREPVTIIATSEDLIDIRRWRITEGRGLDSADMRSHSRVLVVSEPQSRVAGWRTGMVVILDEVPFRIAGVISVDPIDGLPSQEHQENGERFAIIPWTVVPFWHSLANSSRLDLDEILIRAINPDITEKLANNIGRLLAQPGVGAGSVSIVTARKLVANISQLKSVILIAVGAITLMCLLLGAASLTSLMVLNVRERITEIGLRLALGATRRQIAALFIMESVVVTLTAGLVGMVVAIIVSGWMNQWIPLHLELEPSSLIMPPVFALLLGMVSSWWPARAAAGIAPAEAMRVD